MVKIESKEGYIIWSENLSDVKKEEYLFPEDVKGIIVVDGAPYDNIIPSQVYKYKKDRHASSVEMIMSTIKPIHLKWGVGNVPYQDYQAKLSAKCGVSGEIALSIFNTKSAYKQLGKNVTVSDLRSKVFQQITSFIEEAYKVMLENDSFGRPDFSGKKNQLASAIKKKVDDYFAGVGLVTEEVSILNFMVDEEYLSKRDEWEQRKEDKRKMREDLDTFEEIKEVFSDNDEPKVVIKEVVKCPRCGKEISDGQRFCPGCGTKIR